MKITSAHAIAFTALVASIGGGFAVAHNGDTDKVHFCIPSGGGAVSAVAPDANCPGGTEAQDIRVSQVAYLESTGKRTFKAAQGYRLVSKQLIVPANGDWYLIQGKVVVSKPATGSFRGTVTCRLGPTDNTPDDIARVTLGPGETATLNFLSQGKTDGRPGQTAATEISCSAPSSRFTVSNVKLAAQPMGTISGGVL
jgi:hypothetical protein